MSNAHRARFAVLVDVSGRRHQAHRGARRALHRGGPPRPGAGSVRPCRPVLDGPAPGRRAAAAWSAPDYLVPLGRTVGFKANGAVSNLSITPYGVATMHASCAPAATTLFTSTSRSPRCSSWVAGRLDPAADGRHLPRLLREQAAPNGIANLIGARRMLNRLHVRIAVSEAAAWTGRRFFGGHYRVIPNGVTSIPSAPRCAALRPTGDRLRIVFVGQAVERKGLPLLLRAFEALREHIPTELTVIGPTHRGARADDARPARRAVAGQGRRRGQAPRARGRPTCCARRRWAARASEWS